MPDENRSEGAPFSTRNVPSLQRAVLLFLLDEQDTWSSFYAMLAKAGLEKQDERALRAAVTSLRAEGLILVSRTGQMAASASARHFHWLMTEVEPADG
jgi:hypothetical protein